MQLATVCLKWWRVALVQTSAATSVQHRVLTAIQLHATSVYARAHQCAHGVATGAHHVAMILRTLGVIVESGARARLP